MKKIEIFIDNIGFDDEKKFAKQLKNQLLIFKKEIDFSVKLFEDLPPTSDENNDPDNERNTIEAIEAADIVTPVISPRYFEYVTPNIENSYNSIINSDSRYFLPLILAKADWSSYDWLVKSQLTPESGKPLSDLNRAESEIIINEFSNEIKTIIFSLS